MQPDVAAGPRRLFLAIERPEARVACSRIVTGGRIQGLAVAPVDIAVLAAKGSIFLTRPSLMTYTAKRTDLLAHARDLFDVVANDAVTIRVGQTYALKDAAQAHRDLESRANTGSTVLLP